MRLRQELENPMVLPASKWTLQTPATYIDTACDACNDLEATVEFRGVKLCDVCAAENGVRVL